MGQPGIENHGVIDDSFAGLKRPQQTIDMGRPDIKDERPGVTLIEAVRKFEQDGGFKAMRAERDATRERDQAPDDTTFRDGPIDVFLPILPDEAAPTNSED